MWQASWHHLFRKRLKELDMHFCSLFLKRILTDLRVVWSLCLSGYTSQAGTLVCSLFENSLVVQVLSKNKKDALKFMNSRFPELPWSVQELIQMLVRREGEDKGDRKLHRDEFDKQWMERYSVYKWLCNIKHPTYLSALHGSKATKDIDDKGYLLMATPDTSEKDLPFKLMIFQIAILYTKNAIEKYVDGLDPDIETDEYVLVNDILSQVNEEKPTFREAIEKIGPIPFHI
jgi:hypothetical protein